MMARDVSKSTKEPINYGRFINQFQLDIIISIQQLERFKTKICKQKMSILSMYLNMNRSTKRFISFGKLFIFKSYSSLCGPIHFKYLLFSFFGATKRMTKNCCTYTYSGWNEKIVVLKKTTLQLYFKTFIEKINSANLIM